MKPRLCVDIDNCIAATDAVMRRLIRDVTGGRVDFDYDDICGFDYHGPLCRDKRGEGIDGEVWHAVHDKFSQPEVISSIKPIPGAVEALNELLSEFDIHFATTRLPSAWAATVDWLHSIGMAGKHRFALHFVGHRRKHCDLGAVYGAIDDDAEQASLFSNTGAVAILLAHPWNCAGGNGVHRLPSWPAIVEYLLASPHLDRPSPQ